MKAISWIPFLFLFIGLQQTLVAQGTSVAIIADVKFKFNLESEISRLAADIESDLSTHVIIHGVDEGFATPESIRAYIKNLYRTQGLRGTILIGDIPAAKYGDFMSYAPFLTDAFYEDLDDDCWADPDGNGIYNISLDENGDGTDEYLLKAYIGEHNREVWSGRLTPPRSIPLADRVELLKRYLDRDHLYRTGVISYARGLIYSETVSSDDSATIVARAEQIFEGSWLYHKEQGDTLIQCQAADPVSQKDRWLDALGDSVEYAFINVHGTPTNQWFGGSSLLYYSDYRDAPVNACVVDLASCSNGDFSDPDYLAGWVLFGGASLIVKANTTVVGQVGTPRPDPDQRLLSLGQTFGDLGLAYVLSNDPGVLFGDPTLRLRSRGTGPVLEYDTSATVLPTETVQSVPTQYQGGLVRLTNRGDQPVQTYLRIVSLTSINGRRPDIQCSFSLPEFKESFVFDTPLVLQPGQSILTPLTFSYEAATPGDTTGAMAYLGTFRAKACFYTDSPSSPFFWLSFEKTVTPLVPGMPNLSVPANNAVSQAVSLALIWNRSAWGSTYHIQLSTDPHFGYFIVNDSSVVDTVRQVVGLAHSTIYYWRVRAENTAGSSAFSTAWSFTTAPITISTGNLQVSVSDAENWGQPGVNARVVLYNDSGVQVAEGQANASSMVTFSGVPEGTGYYYRVYYNRTTAWGEQFWGEKTGITINANQTTYDTHTHNTPYMPGLSVYLDGTNELLPDSAMRIVQPGTRLRIELQIKNPAYDGAQTVSAYGGLYLDRDKVAPYDVNLTTNPQSYTVGTTKNVIFYYDAPAMPGSYYLSVGAFASSSRYPTALTDASGWHDPAFSVVQAPAVPLLASPADRSTNLPTSLALKWQSVVAALAYHVQLASDSTFTSGVILNDSTIVDTSHASGQLAYSTMYFWRVRAKTSEGMSAFSLPWRFKTLLPLPTQVQLTSPAAGTSANVNTVGFVWRKASPEVTRYWFEMASDSQYVFKTCDSTVVDTFYVRQNLANGTYWWRVKAYNTSGWGVFSESRRLSVLTTDVKDLNNIPTEYVLLQNYPNPFNPSTRIAYGLAANVHVKLTVMNMLGEEVATLVQGEQEAGYHEVRFDASGLSSGVYLYRMQAGSYVETRKLLLVR